MLTDEEKFTQLCNELGLDPEVTTEQQLEYEIENYRFGFKDFLKLPIVPFLGSCILAFLLYILFDPGQDDPSGIDVAFFKMLVVAPIVLMVESGQVFVSMKNLWIRNNSSFSSTRYKFY